jgi:carbon starvation protein
MAVAPLLFVMRTATDAKGNPIPAWKAFWSLFGASNQLLAALALMGITVWLVHRFRARWIWFVTGVPAAFMYVVSVWALAELVRIKFVVNRMWADPVPWVALVLITLAGVMLIEAVTVLNRTLRGSAKPPSGVGPATSNVVPTTA